MRKLLGVLTAKLEVTEPPSATGGRFYYLSPQWHALLWGLLDILDREEFWEDPENGLNWLHEAMAPPTCLECGDDMPPVPEPEPEIKIIYIEREEENDDDESELDCMCNKCGDCVRYDMESKTFYIMDENCQRVDLGAGMGTTPPLTGNGEWDGSQPTPPSTTVPPDNPLYKSVDALRCQKATALVEEMWNVIGVYQGMDEVSSFLGIVGVISTAFIAWWGAAVAAAVGVTTGMELAAAISTIFGSEGATQFAEELEAIYTDEELKSALICDLVQRMAAPIPVLPFTTGILGNHLEAADIRVAIARFEALAEERSIDSENALIVLNVFPISSWQTVVTSKIAATECGCDDFKPYEPPQTEPSEDEFGFYPGEIVGAMTNSITPVASRAASNPRGTKVTELKYLLPVFDSGSDQRSELMVMWEATELVDSIGIEAMVKYTGTDSDSSHTTFMEAYLYRCTLDTDNWALMPGFISQSSFNDSADPEWFTGSPVELIFPWDNSIETTDVKYVGFKLFFLLNSDNEPTSNPSAEVTIKMIKAKAAAGGNYRANLTPGQFVDKAL